MAWVFRIFLSFEIAVFVVQSTDWVDNVTGYIAEDSGARQVVLITELAKDEDIASPIIDEVFSKLAQKLPVLTINILEDRNNAKGRSGGDTSWDPSPIATSATIYLLVHVSRESSPSPPSRGLIDAVAEMASFDYRPRYLVLFVARVLSDGFKDLLEYAWSQKLLDFTILEWIEPKSTTPEKHALDLPIVHRLNPFKNEYTRSDWGSNRDGLFPDKASNMAHYLLRTRAVNVIPFSVAEFNELGEPVFVGGPNILLIQSIAKRLNASTKYIPFDLAPLGSRNRADIERSIYHAGNIQQMDIASYRSARSGESRADSLRTVSIQIDEFCAIVQILPKPGKFDTAPFCKAVVVTLIIVTIYLIAVKLLRFPVSVWRPFNITRALFGISVSQQPRTNAERIMFASLFAISAVYSSNIYTAITNVALLTADEVEYESFDALDKSGLIPQISPFDVEKTFSNSEGVLRNLMNKSETTVCSMMICAQRAAQQKNITCLMKKSRAEVAVMRSRVDGRATIKIAQPCFWTASFGFRLGKRSPYRSIIDSIIYRMQSGGLIQKLYADAKNELIGHNGNDDNSELEKRENMITLRRHLLALVVVGYTVSILTFMAEILIHRLSKSRKKVAKKLDKRPVVLFPYTE